MAFASSSEHSSLAGTPRIRCRSSGVGSSSHGITRFRPSTDQPFARLLPAAPKNCLRVIGTTRQLPFHPRGLSPPRRFAPCDSCKFVAPCCQSWGSPRFPVPAPVTPESAPATWPVPRDAVHTLQRFSLISSRTASLRPLPSCRWSPTSSPVILVRPKPGPARTAAPKCAGTRSAALAEAA
jgi:hypothetical protein